jgi:bifunctional DNA-binding transcriptional regulator/antitoxin component of YhaV-PrlF toxin-antitoxin module
MTRPSFTIRLLITMTVLALADRHHAQAQEAYFPELVFLPKNKDLNSLTDKMTSVHLKAMKEPSLWKLSHKDRTANVYRFLWFARGQHPICIRLTQSGETFTLHVAGHDGPPGMTAGRLTLNKDLKLSRQQGERLVGLLAKTAFWTAPVEVKESRGIADGDEIVLEGVKDGKYHVIDRAGSATGEAYEAFCRALLEIANEPAALKAWDGFRENERNSPGYRAEPSQTEDLGVYELCQNSLDYGVRDFRG